MLVLRHGHPGGKKKQYYLDLDYRVKPDNDIREGISDKPDNDIKRKVKPEYDNKEGCLTWIIGSSPIMT